MTPEEIKALFKKIQSDTKLAIQHRLKLPSGYGYDRVITHREMLLLWGFVRGFKFRRLERTHRFDQGREMNMPRADLLLRVWKHYLPDLTEQQIKSWVWDPAGAIPAPPPRVKKPYVAAAE